jgi:hypothetical protein
MLFRETVAVYCENHTEHRDIYTQFVPHRKRYVSATKPNRLMLFRETVAVYCENRTEHTDTRIYKLSSYLRGEACIHFIRNLQRFSSNQRRRERANQMFLSWKVKKSTQGSNSGSGFLL